MCANHPSRGHAASPNKRQQWLGGRRTRRPREPGFLSLRIPIPAFYLLALLLVLAPAGCGPTQAVYSEQAYRQAVSLKVEALALMGHATEPYAEYRSEAEALMTELRKALEYARGRPDNAISTRQWELLLDPERNLLGGFLARWRQQQRLSAVFVEENRKLIAEAFDAIIGLESGKLRPKEVQ